MSDLLTRLKSLAGEVTAAQFGELMLEGSPKGNECPYFYYNGSQYMTTRDGDVEVPIARTPADVINVEWKRSDETFLDYVNRKAEQLRKAKPEPKVPEPLAFDKMPKELQEKLTALGLDKKPFTREDLVKAGLSVEDLSQLDKMSQQMS